MKNRTRFFFPIIVIIAFLLVIFVINLESQVKSLDNNILMSQNYGGDGDEIIRDIAIDLDGNYVLTGWTSSDNFHSKAEGLYKGQEDSFLAKVDSKGDIIWINFLSGSFSESGASVLVDSNNDIIVAGNTESSDFVPVGTEGLDKTFENNSQDIFISKYHTSGQLIWSTFHGAGGDDLVTSIALDNQNNLIITGFTSSSTSVAYSDLVYGFSYGIDAFVAKFDSSGNKIWGKFIGGSGDDIGYGVAINSENNIYVTGYTNSKDFLLINNSTSTSGNRDIFMAYLDSNGTRLWIDVLGINSNAIADFEFEEKMGLQVDSQDNIILGSWTKTKNFLEDKTLRNGDKNAIILKISSSREMLWFKELSGTSEDRITDLFVDENDFIYVTGITFSFNFPTKYPIFASYRDFGDAFVYVLDDNSNHIWSTYFGGTFLDFSSSILVDKNRELIIAGTTSSFDFPAKQSSNQISGYSDAFLSRILMETDEAKFKFLPGSLQVILENISIFEWIMMLAAIIFSYRSISYYRRTGILEFLLFTGLFLTLAFNSLIQILWYFLSFFDLGEDFSLLRQPIVGLSFVWILLFIHSYRLKWGDPPASVKTTGISLFLVKIMIPLAINLLGLDSLILGFIATLSFVAFDIFVMIILLYSYFSIDLVNPNDRIKRAYRLWQLAWILFFIGFVLLVTMTTIQIWIISVGFEQVDLQLIILFRTLSSFFNSGVYFFIVFLIIGYIAIQYPEGMLLSHAIMLKATELYPLAKVGDIRRTQTKMDDLFLYIQETQKILGKDEE